MVPVFAQVMQTEEFGRTREQISVNPRPQVEGFHLLESSPILFRGLY